jgi:hypothetical protein
MSFSEYPKAMSHPNYRPAVLSQDIVNADKSITKAPPGSPAQFPPVYVNNIDQEQLYASRGYVPNGTPDPEAYAAAVAGVGTPVHHKHVEFPKYLYRSEDGEVVSQLVKDQAAQDKLDGFWYATPDDARDAGDDPGEPETGAGASEGEAEAAATSVKKKR